MLFEAEGVNDLIICILSNQITCTTTVCLVQGCETTAKNRNENFAMPKATQVATGSFLFSNTRGDLSPAGSYLYKQTSWGNGFLVSDVPI